MVLVWEPQSLTAVSPENTLKDFQFIKGNFKQFSRNFHEPETHRAQPLCLLRVCSDFKIVGIYESAFRSNDKCLECRERSTKKLSVQLGQLKPLNINTFRTCLYFLGQQSFFSLNKVHFECSKTKIWIVFKGKLLRIDKSEKSSIWNVRKFKNSWFRWKTVSMSRFSCPLNYGVGN